MFGAIRPQAYTHAQHISLQGNDSDVICEVDASTRRSNLVHTGNPPTGVGWIWEVYHKRLNRSKMCTILWVFGVFEGALDVTWGELDASKLFMFMIKLNWRLARTYKMCPSGQEPLLISHFGIYLYVIRFDSSKPSRARMHCSLSWAGLVANLPRRDRNKPYLAA